MIYHDLVSFYWHRGFTLEYEKNWQCNNHVDIWVASLDKGSLLKIIWYTGIHLSLSLLQFTHVLSGGCTNSTDNWGKGGGSQINQCFFFFKSRAHSLFYPSIVRHPALGTWYRAHCLPEQLSSYVFRSVKAS